MKRPSIKPIPFLREPPKKFHGELSLRAQRVRGARLMPKKGKADGTETAKRKEAAGGRGGGLRDRNAGEERLIKTEREWSIGREEGKRD